MEGAIKIQAVLYENERAALWRFLASLAVAARNFGDRTILHLGDCSNRPLLEPDALTSRCRMLADGGPLEVRYTYFSENLGFGRGHNRLWREAPTANRLLIINPDTVPAYHLLTRLARVAEALPDWGAVDARQIPIEHPKAFNPRTWESSWVSGACCLLDGAAFTAAGGFDETFFLYAEDIDLSWRLRAAGKRLYYCPETFVLHAKRLINRRPGISASERYHGTLSLMLLRAKYGYASLNARMLTLLQNEQAPEQVQMLAEYERLRRELPTVSTQQAAMATFTPDGNLVGQRWTYPLPGRFTTAGPR